MNNEYIETYASQYDGINTYLSQDSWTSGSNILNEVFQSRYVTNQARHIISEIDIEEVSVIAGKLLDTIDKVISIFSDAGIDISHIPIIRAYVTEEKSAIFEWITYSFRIGFIIEPEIDKSGWFIATSKQLDEFLASGSLKNLDIESFVSSFVKFVLINT